MKQDLLEAINKRKQKVLQAAIGVFNKVQDLSLKSVRLNSVTEESHSETQQSEIKDQLEKFDLLLNNPRSPIFSALHTTANYKGDKNVEPFRDMY